jgi:apolipoprotein N-acyltransferase
MTTLAFTYGYMAISKSAAQKSIKVSVVQGNIEQVKKWDSKYAEFIMQTYADLTQEASKYKPELIIWPESATPKAISKNRMLYDEVRRITSASGTYLLLGSAHHQKLRGKDRVEVKYRNSAFLIHPNREVKNQRYDKIKLLPFGEYLPMREIIPWSYVNIPDIGSYVSGEEITIFEGPTFHFGVTICWENVFPDLVRQFVKRGAQFIVNITNEAWFGRTAAPYQFVSISVFRAVENRVFVVRSANTGVSCFIDPYGRIVDRVKDSNGQDIFVRGVLTGSVIPAENKTIYTRYGDWFAWLSILGSVVFLIVAFLKKKH